MKSKLLKLYLLSKANIRDIAIVDLYDIRFYAVLNFKNNRNGNI